MQVDLLHCGQRIVRKDVRHGDNAGSRTMAFSGEQKSSGRSEEHFMRAVDDGSPRYAAVLKILQAWKQLPESDVARMLHDYYLITDDFREMEDQGLLTMSFVGDEYMLVPTLVGRLWLEQYNSEGKK